MNVDIIWIVILTILFSVITVIGAIGVLGFVDLLLGGLSGRGGYTLSTPECREREVPEPLPMVSAFDLSDSNAGQRILFDISKGDIELDPYSTPSVGAKYFFDRIHSAYTGESWIELVIDHVEHDGDMVRITDSHHPGATFLIPRTLDVAITNAG